MPGPRRRLAALALLCAVQFVDVMSVTIVVVALPTIQRDLGFAEADVQWVVSAYALAFAGFLVLAGRAADLYGRRRLFCAGIALFGAGSLLCGLAPSPVVLVLARALQGLGAAVAVPAALSLLTAMFSEPAERARALGAWTAAAAGGGASGYAVGGLVTEAAGWEWAFLVAVPVAVLALAAARLVLPAGGARAEERLDVAGAVAVTAGLVLVVYGFSAAERAGFASPEVVIALAVGAAALALFVVIERRVEDPIAPPRVVAIRAVAVACLVSALLTAVTTPAGVLATIVLQDARDLGAGQAALALLPFSVAVIAGSAAGSRLTPRAGARPTMGGGLAAIAAAMALAATVSATSPLVLLVAALVLAGLGLGAASVAATATGVGAVQAADEGLASGLLNTAAQVGTAVGIAVFLSLASAVTGSAGEGSAAVVDGVRAGYAAGAVLALAAAVAAVVLLPRRAAAAAAAG